MVTDGIKRKKQPKFGMGHGNLHGWVGSDKSKKIPMVGM